MRDHAAGILEQVFPGEWLSLGWSQSHLVAVDFLDACHEENIGAREYARRIGAGNLASYARTMEARAADPRRTWEQG